MEAHMAPSQAPVSSLPVISEERETLIPSTAPRAKPTPAMTTKALKNMEPDACYEVFQMVGFACLMLAGVYSAIRGWLAVDWWLCLVLAWGFACSVMAFRRRRQALRDLEVLWVSFSKPGEFVSGCPPTGGQPNYPHRT